MIGKTIVERPEGFGVIPTVVEEERGQFHTALLRQFMLEQVHTIQRASLVIGREIAEIVPGVVVKKSSVGMRPLPLHIRKEAAPHLPGTCDTSYRRVCDRLACAKGQVPIYPSGSSVACNLALRQRM